MGYVGNEPSVNFTSFAKQDITGDGGANYTLTYAVANANEIEVFVNNVRQEPTEAYTVSGTALSMTGNVASTDDFYVIYLGKALQTVVPPDGSVSTAKIADSAVTSAKLDTNIAIDGDLTVDTSTLKVDSTNNRVGIGTTNPSVPLNVVNSTSSSIRANQTNNGTDVRMVADATGAHMGSYAGTSLFLKANSDTKLTITTNGDVGIGTTSPSSKLQVAGTVTATAFSGDGSGLSGVGGSTDLNAVGTYAFMYVNSVTTPGGTRSQGAQILRYSANNAATTSTVVPSGTWRVMGWLQSDQRATVMVRIA